MTLEGKDSKRDCMALANAKSQPLTSGKLKLMICDDSNIIRRKIERELQIDRLQVIATAANGKLAVEAFRKEPADVVTMDLTMPEMDGIEILRALRGGPAPPRVLVMTGGSVLLKRDFLDAARMLGADATIAKPFGASDLAAAVAEALAARRP